MPSSRWTGWGLCRGLHGVILGAASDSYLAVSFVWLERIAALSVKWHVDSQGVSAPYRYEPEVNPTHLEMAA